MCLSVSLKVCRTRYFICGINDINDNDNDNVWQIEEKHPGTYFRELGKGRLFMHF